MGRTGKGRGKESGHTQMLCQAAAMLVSFPALIAAEVHPGAAPPALLHKRLAIAGTANVGDVEDGRSQIILQGRLVFHVRHVIQVVVNGTTIGRDKLPAG